MNSKYFPNNFEDFSNLSSINVLSNYQINEDSIIYDKEKIIWNKDFSKFTQKWDSDYTVYTGSAGIALYYLRRSARCPELLKECIKYLPLHKLKQSRVTFLCGDAGPLAIAAVVYYKLGDRDEMNRIVQKLVNISQNVLDVKSDVPNELLYGRTGYLYALLFVNANVDTDPIDEKLIKKVIKIIFIQGQQGAKSCKLSISLMYQWHGKHYLGAAHGLSGILYILLQASHYLSESELKTLIKPSIDELAKLRYPSGNYMSSLENDSDRLIQWCHGAPGFTHMFCEAYRVFQDDTYLQLALECGEMVWERGIIRKGFSICHGVAGNAYTFLELFRATKDPKHLYRAAKFAEWCVTGHSQYEEHKPDRPGSLFEGLTGKLCLIEDLRDPLNAKFPAFTV